MTVSRETLAALVARYALPQAAIDAFERLLVALADEPDPPTAVRDPAQAVDIHIADSLSGLEVPELRGASRIADLGSGAGFPGLPLAVALPDATVDLIESAQRKAEVIERLAEAARVAGRARPRAVRAEDWALADGAEAYDIVTARALAPLPVLVEYAAPLLRPNGLLVAWKGQPDAREERVGATAAAEVGLEPRASLPVTPYEGSRRHHLYLYSKVRETPERFPRRPGIAAKRPLGSLKQPQPDGDVPAHIGRAPARRGDRAEGANRP